MLKNQCISVTDLRTKTKECVEGLEKAPKYIFVNNKPIAVLVDIEEYEHHFLRPTLTELSLDEVDTKLLKSAAAAKKMRKSDLINI